MPQGFDIDSDEANRACSRLICPLPFGLLSHEEGESLKAHLLEASAQPDGASEWQEGREAFTGKPFYMHVVSGELRSAPPQIFLSVEATLWTVNESTFLPHLRKVVELKPRGVVVSEEAWRPDVSLVQLPADWVDETAEVPIVMVSYEAGEQLRSLLRDGSEPWVTMEVQPYGGVYAWGMCNSGQLGLADIVHRNDLIRDMNVRTDEPRIHANLPCYVAHLHEHEVTNIACGAAHSLACSRDGKVFSWGRLEGLGAPLPSGQSSSDVPLYVEQLEGLVQAYRVLAGHHQSFALATLPHNPLV
jgi:hypothetical protein